MGRHSRRSPSEVGDPSGKVPPPTGAPEGSAPQHAPGPPRYGAARDTPPGGTPSGGTPRPTAAYRTPPTGPAGRARPFPAAPSAPGTPGHGSAVPGTPAHGTPAHGSAVPGTPAHGTPGPRAPQYATPVRGTPTYGPSRSRAAGPPSGQRPGPGPDTPVHGTPRPSADVRGAHPHHPEDTGAFDGFRSGGGQAQRPAGRFPQGGPSAPTVRAYGTHRLGSPRQEYIDAFDDDVYFGTGPERTGTPGRIPGARSERGAPRAEHGRTPPEGPEERAERDTADDDPQGPAEPAERRVRRERRGWGRTLSGVTAAAVTTVLAVVVAGEVTGGESARDDRTAGQADVQRAGEGDSSRSRVRQDAPSDTPPRKRAQAPLTYAQRLDQPVTLDPKLRASGKFVTVSGTEKGGRQGEVVRYRVDVEQGVPVDGAFFATAVHRTLNDERSWAHEGARSFHRVSSGDADFVITLASPGTTADWCAKSGLDTTVDNVSCDSAATERVVINAYRWAQGAETYGEEMAAYRQMLINHEVGHRLGRNHDSCTKDGAPAPVMMQQTKTLTTGNNTCRPNPWPFA